MNSPRAIGAIAGALLAAGVVGVLAAGGCSKKETTPPPVVKVQPAQPAPPQAAVGAPAPAAGPAKAQAPGLGANPGRQVGESVLRGPGEYLYTATVTVPRYAKKTISATYIEREIREFQALKGRWPKSLDELGQWLGEPVQAAPPGTKYSYDPSTGALEVVPAD